MLAGSIIRLEQMEHGSHGLRLCYDSNNLANKPGLARRIASFVISTIFLALPITAFSASNDNKLQLWASLYNQSKLDELAASVASDLTLAAPHPQAAIVWLGTHRALGESPLQAAVALNQQARVALGALPEVAQADLDGKNQALLQQFPPEKVTSESADVLVRLADVANETGQSLLAFRYLAIAAQRDPRNVDVASAALTAWNSDGAPQSALASARDDLVVGLDPELAQLVRELLVLPSPDASDVAILMGRWLQTHPDDLRALKWLANELAALNLDGKAEPVLRQAIEKTPYFESLLLALTKILIRQQRTEEADRLLRQYGWLRFPGQDSEQRQCELLAAALRTAGEYGAAERSLSASLSRWPDDIQLLRERESLEEGNGRWRQAADAAAAILVRAPTDQSAYRSLTYDLYQLGDTERALTARDRYLSSTGTETVGSRNDIVLLLEEHGRPQDAAVLGSDWLQKNPYSFSVAGNTAEALRRSGNINESLAAFKALFSWHPPTRYYLELFLAASDADGLDTSEELANLQKSWPRDEDVWWASEAWLAPKDPDKRQRRELWQRAISTAPDVPIYWVAAAALDDDAPATALSTLREGRDAVSASRPSARANLLRYRADVAAYATENRKIDVDTALISELLSDMEVFRDNDQSLSEYHRVRYRLFTLLDREDDARTEAVARAQANPDDGDAVWELTAGNIKNVHRTDSFGRLARLVDRNPYSYTLLSKAAKLHAYYGGSPLWVFRLRKQAQTLSMISSQEADLDEDVTEARGDLGDARTVFKQYLGSDHIGQSERYLQWFKDWRRRAQDPGSFIEEDSIDTDRLSIKLLEPGGMEIEAHWDPVTAFLSYYKVGAAWIAAAYEGPGGLVSRLWDSAGNDIRLDWAGERIIRVASSRGKDLSFSYDEKGRQAYIGVSDEGGLRITYDADGKQNVSAEGSNSRLIALSITTTVQNLEQAIVRISRPSFTDAPELPFADPQVERMKRAVYQAGSGMRLAQAENSLAHYLLDHLKDRRGYATEIESKVSDIWEGVKAHRLPAALGLDAVELFHDLQLQIRRQGLASKDWKRWIEMRTWLSAYKLSAAERTRVAALNAKLAAEPLAELPPVPWVRSSYIDTEGYWQRTPWNSVVSPDIARRIQPRLALARKNGDLMVGTNLGLVVFHAGYWRWYAFDEVAKSWVPTPPLPTIHTTSDVRSLAEDAAGNVWAGTAGGLIRLARDYDSKVEAWITDTLPSPQVNALSPWKGGILAGTDRGLVFFDGTAPGPLPRGLEPWADHAVRLLRSYEPAQQPGWILCSGSLGTALADGQNVPKVLGLEPLLDATWDPLDGALYLLYNDSLRKLSPGIKSGATVVPAFNQIMQSRAVYGLGLVPLDDREQVLTVLSDTGLSFLRDGHFEAKKLPLSDHLASADLLASSGDRTAVVSDDGLYLLERGNAVSDHDGPVDDLLVDNKQKVTFIARSRRELQLIRHEEIAKGAETLGSIEVDRLAQDHEGRLLANDGSTILRFAPGKTEPETIFELEPAPGEKNFGFFRVTSILVASDDSVWVTYGASVYHWREGDTKPDQFSAYIDAKRFPGRTDAVSRVLETTDGRIWVVASDESHIKNRGEELAGGLLEWDGQGFQRLDQMAGARWFITSYTPIGDGSAIVGTASGFARYRNGFYASVEERHEQSYLDLKQHNPMLFLGSQGAKLSNSTTTGSTTGEVWLFGTAGGLIAYENGRWFSPDRLNWMLPDQQLEQYGSRGVNAVATDAAGRVYAGTSRGLLIYDSGGGDPNEFLVSNRHEDLAFEEMEEEKQREQSETLLSGLDPDSRLGRLYYQYSGLHRDMEKLNELLGAGQRLPPLHSPAADPNPLPNPNQTSDGSEELRRRLNAEEAANQQLMKELDSDPLLRGQLQLNPFDLNALRDRLGPHEIVLQLLPTATALHINLVTHDGNVAKYSKVSKDEIEMRAQRVAFSLQQRAESPAVGRLSALLADTALSDDLHFLYNAIFGPVETLLTGASHVYVSSAGPLAYVPYGALISRMTASPEYAIQKWTIGYVPSLFLFDALRKDRIGEPRSLILAPDESLQGAEQEAGAVYALSPQLTDLKRGQQADLDALLQYGPAAGKILFATHATFNPLSPMASYLVLAHGKHLSPAAITDLNLKHTDLVVLSACETALGRGDGTDYATMALAFGHAGVPSIVATLWEVPDAPASQLVQSFFKFYKGDSYAALADAQRKMIAGDARMADPSSWAGFIPLGRP